MNENNASPEEIKAYLKKDPILFEAIERNELLVHPELTTDIYKALLESIVSQQLSTKVARIIWNRFVDLFDQRYPDPQSLLAMEHQTLRAIGLSNSKANYVRNVAAFNESHSLAFDHLEGMKDDEVIQHLTQIKGVGPWTVQMILMFPMDRPDVFPVGDLGIQNTMKSLYGLDLEKKKLLPALEQIAESWSPFKTTASKYIWKIGDGGGI